MNHELASAIVNSTRHLLISTDPTGVVTFFNPASERQLGYRADEVVGLESPALWHLETEVVERARELSSELGQVVEPGFDVFTMVPRARGEETREWMFVCKDGTCFPAQLTVTCIRSKGEITGYLGVIEDITERRRAQTELEDAKAFLDLMFRSIPDLIFVKDREFRIVQANPTFLQLYPERKRDKVLGFTTFEDYDAEEAAAFTQQDREAFRKGMSETVETIAFPDGKTRILNTKKIRFVAQGAEFILGIGRDVTEREELIERLRESNAELEEFAYRTSHDLRSPLVSSLRLLEIAQQAIETGDEGTLTTSLDHVTQSLRKLETLVADILKLARAKNGPEEITEVDIPAVISESLTSLKHLDGFERLSVHRNIQAKTVRTRASRVSLIVENLLSNAIKYQDPESEEPFIRISSDWNGDAFELVVEDNGRGIPEHQRHKLFRMFMRFHTRVSFGSGLGLYMMKKSAEALGGTIQYQALQSGSRFTLSIPGDE